jgi:hypothetical protein
VITEKCLHPNAENSILHKSRLITSSTDESMSPFQAFQAFKMKNTTDTAPQKGEVEEIPCPPQ